MNIFRSSRILRSGQACVIHGLKILYRLRRSSTRFSEIFQLFYLPLSSRTRKELENWRARSSFLPSSLPRVETRFETVWGEEMGDDSHDKLGDRPSVRRSKWLAANLTTRKLNLSNPDLIHAFNSRNIREIEIGQFILESYIIIIILLLKFILYFY